VGNALNNTMTGNALGNTLNGGAGADTMLGGLGNDTYVVDNAGDSVVETSVLSTEIDTVQSSITYTLGANLENLTLTGTAALNGTGNAMSNVMAGNDASNVLDGAGGNDTLSAGGGNDTLIGGAGNDVLDGGAGNDTYQFGLGMGQDQITESYGTLGNTDVLQWGPGIAADQLWLRHVGNALEVSIIGTNDKVTISNWYAGASNQVEQFQLSNGLTLTNTRVEQLVQAMAAFAPPAPGQTTLSNAQHAALDTVIASNWI
jgi:Ca2+-binding RTX toxin-like protein